MNKYLMAVPGTRQISGDDKIFGISKAAQDMAAEVGADKVINATIGALLDDEGNLMVMPSIIDIYRSLSPAEIAEYAPIAGVPSFLKNVKKAVFGKYTPNGYIESVATPGGTGAIRNTIQNYSALGDTVLTTDWFWSPYKNISDELGRKLDTFTMFDADKNLNLSSFSSKVEEILSRQTQLVIIFNAPAHNPTGFTPSDSEWDSIVDILKKNADNTDKKIIFFIDAAYIDFAGEEDASRAFFSKFSDLPENILVIVAFSMSKGYTLYGMRSGAMICVTPSADIAAEFKTVNMFSNRATWSNGTRPAMMILSKIFEDETLYNKVAAERAEFRKVLDDRAKVFIEYSNKYGLEMCPFKGGFFITVLCDNAEEIGKKLQKEGVFMVPIGKGLRFAVSAVSEEKCKIVPEKIAAAIGK
ncbi:MAG: aminotransferase class I/II-fold pyridoxal phosphate-dependent enzyme [Clostridiales bacterium]|nr:aminotransferase class I/II-fold pyridoxal phosphate-dependent enzyme [Clostridiales bacterium]